MRLDGHAPRRRQSSIFVAGHRGLVGSAIVRRLHRDGFNNIVTRTRAQLDLTDQAAVAAFFATYKPEYIFLAAARVGGIQANEQYAADFIRDNLAIQTNVIHAAYTHGATKLMFLGSSCIYPKHARQPMAEDSLLTGALEPTNQWYAIAKIAGIKLCQAYRRQYGFDAICVMPTNLYGPGDNFDPQTSHVLPALIRKCHEAKCANAATVTLWGSGTPRREFLYVDDLADACIFLMQRYSDEQPLNIGVGEDIAIRELAAVIAEIVGFDGGFVLDPSKPDGTPRKLLDVSRLRALGWRPSVGLRAGIERTYAAFLEENQTAAPATTERGAAEHGPR